MRRCAVFVAAVCWGVGAAAVGAEPWLAGPVPEAERQRLALPAFYTQYVRSAAGIPVVSSPEVTPQALAEAAWLLERMLATRPDVAAAIGRSPARFVVMAHDEFTTQVPEHSHLEPRDHWDRRARGLGGDIDQPATSCGEENLLCFEGDPYAAENILIHEFAHTIHQVGLAQVDPTFHKRLDAAYEEAKSAGRWQGTYAMTNAAEYWAEGVQSWFRCNRTRDEVHGEVNSPEALREHDPPLAALLTEVFGAEPWAYRRPHDREPADREHVAGFDRATAPKFDWANRRATPDDE